jgi:hypothetical protein
MEKVTAVEMPENLELDLEFPGPVNYEKALTDRLVELRLKHGKDWYSVVSNRPLETADVEDEE